MIILVIITTQFTGSFFCNYRCEFIIKWFLYVKQNGDIEKKLTLEKNHDS